MSRNISTWRTKGIKNFTISIENLQNEDSDFFHPTILSTENGIEISIDLCAEDSEIKGILKGEILEITELIIRGESSGYCWDIIKPIFTKSKGYFRAIQIWERGDSIVELVINDGVITETEIEL